MKKNENTQYVFIDSGIGGLAYLNMLLASEPNVSCAYIADNLNFPYGVKKQRDLVDIAINLVAQSIKRFNPQVIILACNTISVSALEQLRKNFSVPFVGTVPAIKVATETTKNGNIGVIASEKTINDEYTKYLIDTFGKNCKFTLLPEPDLIAQIENGLIFKSIDEQKKAVKPAMDFFVKHSVDCIVLACTHFLLIEEAFKAMAEPDITVTESLRGVIKQTLRVSPPIIQNNTNSFFLTAEANIADTEKYKNIAKKFGLNFEGVLN